MSKQKVKIHLYKDAERNKDDVFAALNGRSYLIKRGEDVFVPPEIAEVLSNAQRQNEKAAQTVKELANDGK